MSAPWVLLWILGLIRSAHSSCSPTSYYKSCWIRRFPGLYVDTEESQRRGAQILRVYQEETAVKCSRACCLTPNFSCNLAVFHFNTTQDSVNCFHLQCPTLESCIPHHRGNVILYNVTKGVDPDLLVFGKYFTTNVRVLPHMSSARLNISEPLTSDKRQFNYPPNPPVHSTSTKMPTSPQKTTQAIPMTHEVQRSLPQCTTIPTTTAQSTSEHTSQPKMDSTTSPQLGTSTPYWESTNLRHTTQMDEPDTSADTLNQSIPSSSSVYTTSPHPNSTTDYLDSNLTSIPIEEHPSSSTIQQPLGLQTSTIQTTTSLVTASPKIFTNIFIRTQQPLTRSTEQAILQAKSTSTTSEEYPQTSVSTTVSKTYTTTSEASTTAYETVQSTNSQSISERLISTLSQLKTDSTLSSQQRTATLQGESSKILTSTNVPLETSTKIMSAYTTIPVTTSQRMSEHVTPTASQLKMDSTLNPQWTTTMQRLPTTKPITSTNIPIQTSTQMNSANTKGQVTTAQSMSEHLTPTTSQLKMDSTLNPQWTTSMQQWTITKAITSTNIPIQTSTEMSSAYLKIQDTTAQSESEHLSTTSQLKMDSTLNSQWTTIMQRLPTTKSITSSKTPILTSTQITPVDTRQVTTSQRMSEHVTPTASQLKMDSTLNPQWTTTMQRWPTTKPITPTNIPIQTSTKMNSANTNRQVTTGQSMSEHLTPTTSQLKMDSTLNPQLTTSMQQSPKAKPTTSTNIPKQTSTEMNSAHPTTKVTTAQRSSEHATPSTSELKLDSQHTTTLQQLQSTKPITSTHIPLQTSTQVPPAYKTSTSHLRSPNQTTTLPQAKETTSRDKETSKIFTTTSTTIKTDDSTTLRYLTHTRMANSASTGSLSSSLTAPTSSMVDSQPYPNDTKGYISRNVTTGDAPRPSGDGSLTSVWHLAANTVLVALATCATITFCCCCSVFAALSWRGRRRRKGRYRTNLRCKRGSMRLIKYVIVRESS